MTIPLTLVAREKEFINSRSPLMKRLFKTLPEVASAQAAVLILGESGSGKEVLAQLIHQNSKHKDKPFVVINCSAIPENLMESELFGHLKGAFTGAFQEKKGLFEQAQGGTVFLDEIGEVPLSIQVKLLRVLQEKEIQKVGSINSTKVDIRVIAATHRDLQEMIAQKKFREDLFYRLNVITLQLPPLRNRSEDIEQLIEYFLKKFSEKTRKKILSVHAEALQALKNYNWPGNIRELENIIERSVVLCETKEILLKDLPYKISGHKLNFTQPHFKSEWVSYPYKEAKQFALDQFNEHYLYHLLQKTENNISLASSLAGLDRSNFKKILKKYLRS
ncbi:MAG: sigma-54-dependent Fis family transcriptional regulator [Deltaproteobacteria bacterium]|nr:sigma-54-dependent Fis family transcriptional regulator [Deltaproteobacteria bacterium]